MRFSMTADQLFTKEMEKMKIKTKDWVKKIISSLTADLISE